MRLAIDNDKLLKFKLLCRTGYEPDVSEFRFDIENTAHLTLIFRDPVVFSDLCERDVGFSFSRRNRLGTTLTVTGRVIAEASTRCCIH
jgi:hypothetical protein